MKSKNEKLITDADLKPIQVSGYSQFKDDNQNDLKKSPITLADGSSVELIIPENAVVVSIDSSVDLIYGITEDDVNDSGDGYSLIRAEIEYTKGIAKQEKFNLKNNSGSEALIYFEFSMI